jgi:hypothetical protein
MLKTAVVTVFALAAFAVASAPLRAGNATDGIVVYSPIDNVTVVTVSTVVDTGADSEGSPGVNVFNEVIVVTLRGHHWRCGIGVPYPWQRRLCGDPLYPF